MNITVLGFTLPLHVIEDIIEHDDIMPIQTHKFSWSVVNALASSNNVISLISTHPVSNYPGNKRLFFRGKHFKHGNVTGVSISFINFLVFKHFTRFVACLTQGCSALFRFKPDIIIVYGVHSPFLLFGLFVRLFSRVKFVVILTDPPGVIRPKDGFFARTLKLIDIFLVKAALKGAHGVVALTQPLAKDFAANIPHLLLEGIVSELVESTAVSLAHISGLQVKDKKFKIMYAGGISHAYGVDVLIEAFKLIESNEFSLDLFGKGDLSDWVKEQAACDDRIVFHGFCSQSELIKRISSASLLVNPRPINQGFVPYSFPSKLLDYMAFGIPVVTSNLSGIPEEYSRFLYYFEREDCVSIKNKIFEISLLPSEETSKKSEAAREFVLAEKTELAQGKRLNGFLKTLI